MRAEYDSKADALSIDLLDVECWDRGEPVDDDYTCNVTFSKGRPANVELLYPGGHPEHLRLLNDAADTYGLDAEALQAAAQSALAAPDRPVTLEVGALTRA